MIDLLRTMPNGVRFFLVYAFVLLFGLSLTLPLVVAQAVTAPVSPLGLIWMLALAYVIFTITLVLQRKQAAWGLALGLATLTVPGVALLFGWAGVPGAIGGIALCLLLFLSLRSGAARTWFSQP
jgi:hypothetical protein